MAWDVRRPAGKAEAGVAHSRAAGKAQIGERGVLNGTVCRDRGKRGSVIC
jgi:hypothetical protein